VSQVNAIIGVRHSAKRIVTLVAFAVAAPFFITPTTHAEDGDPEPPTIIVPAACSAPAPEASAPGFHFVSPAPTNNPGLNWTWSFAPPEVEPPFVADNYSYAIYQGGTLESQGVLAAGATTLGYAAPTDGSYTLYLWTIEGLNEPSYCGIATINLDRTPPAITNNGYTLTDSVATPLLSTAETGLTYSWSVNDLGLGVTISDLAALNPTFTFLQDGTYNFTLLATDIFGNSVTVPLTITYVIPFVPPPDDEDPPVVVIPEETIPDPVQEYTPITEATPVTSHTPTPTVDGKLPPEVDATLYASTPEGRKALNPTEKDVVGVVTAGVDGWKIWGVSWYWWLLLVAILSAGTVWILRVSRSGSGADDI